MSEEMAPGTIDGLRAVVADGVRLLDPPERTGGSRLLARVEPSNGEELAECLGVFARCREPVLVTGAGTQLDLGNPARGVSVALSCRRLSGIVELDAADGVVQVSAGTPLAELDREVEAQGWLLPLDPPNRGGTVGGALATATCGPRQRGFGPVRDAVLGMDTVMASGARTRCGARVVKNVTGYDLAKLYVGSLGTLVVMEKVWLRLKPIPASIRVLEVDPLDAQEAFGLAVAAGRRSSARAVALVGPEPGTEKKNSDHWRLVAEFAGEAAATDADANWLAAGRPAKAGSEASIEAVRVLQGERKPMGLKARLHLLPGALAAACVDLQAYGARVLAYPEPGVVHASFEPSGKSTLDWLPGVLGRLEEISVAAGGQWVVEALPEEARADWDVFAGASGLALMRSIKERFDPDAILNPGRFAGRI